MRLDESNKGGTSFKYTTELFIRPIRAAFLVDLQKTKTKYLSLTEQHRVNKYIIWEQTLAVFSDLLCVCLQFDITNPFIVSSRYRDSAVSPFSCCFFSAWRPSCQYCISQYRPTAGTELNCRLKDWAVLWGLTKSNTNSPEQIVIVNAGF